MAGKQKYSDDYIHEEALKYETRIEFQKNSKHYTTARYRGILDKVCSHMKKRHYKKKYSDDCIYEEALKYKTRGEFQENSNNYYFLAFNRGILDKVCSHMKKCTQTWTHELVLEKAREYKTLKEFALENSSAYRYALRNNIKDKVCSHFPKPFRWDIKSCIKEAKKYDYRLDFQNNSNGAYKWAYRNKILDEVCIHMKKHKYTPRGRSNYEGRKTILYYIKVNNIYKIGITLFNKDEKYSILKRRYGTDIKNGAIIEILDYFTFDEGTEAWDKEYYIKEEYYDKRYKGEDMTWFNGHTELFCEDIYEDIKDKFC